MKICYITCCDNGFYGLKKLVLSGHQIACVVTISPSVAERNIVSGFVDVTSWCNQMAIPVIVLPTYTLEPLHLKDIAFDVVLVNGWNRLIPSDVINMAPYGGLGIHAGHPPIGLGRAPLVWNILKGFKDLETYVFKLTAGADDGPIMALRPVEITLHDNVSTLYQKVMHAGAELFDTALNALDSGLPGTEQSKEDIHYYEKRTPDDGLIDFSQSSDQLCNFIRAQSHPYPGAFTYLDDQKVHLWNAIPFDTHAFRGRVRHPGEILLALPSGIVVQTGDTPLWILEADSNASFRIPDLQEEMELFVGKRFSSNIRT